MPPDGVQSRERAECRQAAPLPAEPETGQSQTLRATPVAHHSGVQMTTERGVRGCTRLVQQADSVPERALGKNRKPRRRKQLMGSQVVIPGNRPQGAFQSPRPVAQLFKHCSVAHSGSMKGVAQKNDFRGTRCSCEISQTPQIVRGGSSRDRDAARTENRTFAEVRIRHKNRF